MQVIDLTQTTYRIKFQLGALGPVRHRTLKAAIRERNRVKAYGRKCGDCQRVTIAAFEPDGERELTDFEWAKIDAAADGR